MTKFILLGLTVALAAPAFAGDPAAGEDTFKKCKACHSIVAPDGTEIQKGGRTGPNLYGVVGRPKASVQGFNYSAAMRAKGGEWTIEELNAFLANPKAHVPGTTMAFAGLPRGTERADVIAFLNSRADNPAPLPKAAEAQGAPRAQ